MKTKKKTTKTQLAPGAPQHNPKILLAIYKAYGLPTPKLNYVLDKKAKLVLAVAWPATKVGVVTVPITGKMADVIGVLEWFCYMCQPHEIASPAVVKVLKRAISERE